jgi:hypothetical protein
MVLTENISMTGAMAVPRIVTLETYEVLNAVV